MPRRGYYKAIRTVDTIVNEKIKVLREFYVVDIHNEESIRNMLLKAINERPDSNPDAIADRIAKSLIAAKL